MLKGELYYLILGNAVRATRLTMFTYRLVGSNRKWETEFPGSVREDTLDLIELWVEPSRLYSMSDLRAFTRQLIKESPRLQAVHAPDVLGGSWVGRAQVQRLR